MSERSISKSGGEKWQKRGEVQKERHKRRAGKQT
jgi:hypothetical protein